MTCREEVVAVRRVRGATKIGDLRGRRFQELGIAWVVIKLMVDVVS